MNEQDQRQPNSPLQGDRGSTTIKDGVVQKLTGMAAGEVDGVRMGGSASRAAGGMLESITGSQSQTRGVSVDVGQVETAIDLSMAVEYGKNILQTTARVRERISERVESLTGLRVTELNVTINDIVSSEGDEQGRQDSEGGPLAEDETRARGEGEPRVRRAGAGGSDTTATESRATRDRGSSGDREEVRVEGAPLEEDETRELSIGDDETRGGSSGGGRRGGSDRDRDR